MNTDLWQFIKEHLTNNERVILMVVIDVQGSSPGRAGFKMAVAEKGDICGSIGGGVMEYNMVEEARRMTKDKDAEICIRRQVHESDAVKDNSGLICAGEQTQAFIPLSGSYIKIISGILECLDNGEKGTLSISPEGLFFSDMVPGQDRISVVLKDTGNWEYNEQVGLPDTVYIFGAGHVSVPLSQILRMLDFRVVVFDDRENLSTFISNKHTHQKKVIDFHNAGAHVREGENSYAAIMSFGHRSDSLILSQLLPKKLKYLGMIGSRNKVQSIYESLRKEGFTNDDFARVDSPIGISVNSQTPAEIAVSIAAKIIQTKNTK